MDALALAVATAVLQYLVDKADLIENVRGWLKRDPASLAYQRALLRAYAAFVRSDPALAKSFFDETFLAHAAVPELAKQLTREQHADAGELARVWASSLYPDALADQRDAWATDVRVVDACAQFLQWLENELKYDDVFQPLFDSRVLDSLEAKFDELVRILTIQRNEALRDAEVHEPIINQTVQRDGIEISGNANVVIYGDMVGGDKIVQREVRRRPLYERYVAREVADHVEHLLHDYLTLFVGRDDEIGRLDSFLNDKPSGVIVVTAKAGFGKTALLANWVYSRQGRDCFIAYHFFNHADEGTRSVINAYRNLLRQLYIYEEIADERIPNDENELREALYAFMQEHGAHADEPLVIVIDGLDEADKIFSSPFPAQLPEGVFIIASARADEAVETESLRNWVATAERLHLSRLSDMAIGDYLKQAGNGELAQLAQDRSFVAEVAEKTEGYPLYLRYLSDEMIAAVEMGQDIQATLTRSPRGFSDYVRLQLRILAEVVHQQHEVQDLFSIMSVALGALSEEDLQELTGLTTIDFLALPRQVTRWLSIQTLPNGPSRYLFAHPSLADEFGHALGRQAQQARSKILRYCADWKENRSLYALRYFAPQLYHTRHWDELFALVRDEAFAFAQLEYVPDEPDLPLKSVQNALSGAIETDNAEAIAEFLLTHGRRVLQMAKQSPLEVLRSGNLVRSWRLADLQTKERSILWHLLIAWELKDADKIEDSKQTLAGLNQEFPTLSGWQSQLAGQVLLHLDDVDEQTFLQIQRRLESADSIGLCAYLLSRKKIELAHAVAKGISWSNEIDLTRLIGGVQSASEVALAFSMVAGAHLQEGDLAAAWETAQDLPGLGDEVVGRIEIPTELRREDVLKRIAASQVQQGDVTGVLEKARGIENVFYRVHVLRAIALAVAQSSGIEKAGEIFVETFHSALELDNKRRRIREVLSILVSLIEVGDKDTAFQLVESVGEMHLWGSAMKEVAFHYLDSGDTAAALDAFGIAVETLGTLKDVDPKWQVSTMLDIAGGQATAGDKASALQTLALALEHSNSIEDAYDRELERKTIAAKQAELGDVDAAFKTAFGIFERELIFADALHDIGVARARVGDLDTAQGAFEDALKTVKHEIFERQYRLGISNDDPEYLKFLETKRALGDLISEIHPIPQTVQSSSKAPISDTYLNMCFRRIEEIESDKLFETALAQAKAGDITTSIDTAREINDPHKRADVLRAIVWATANAKGSDIALLVAREFGDQGQRADAEMQIMRLQIEKRDIKTGLEIAQKIDDPRRRSEALRMIALVQVESNDLLGALRIAKEIEKEFEYEQQPIFSAIAVRQAGTGNIGEALETIGLIADANSRLEVLIEIASIKIAEAKISDAEAILGYISPLYPRASLLRQIGVMYEQNGDLIAARERFASARTIFAELVVETVQNTYAFEQTGALREIAVASSIAGMTDTARQIFEDAVENARHEEDQRQQANMLAEIATSQARAGEIDAAWETLKQVGEFNREGVLIHFAVGEAELGNLESALKIAGEIEHEYLKPKSYVEIALVQTRHGDRSGALQTLTTALQVVQSRSFPRQNEILLEVAMALSNVGDIATALKIAETLEPDTAKIKLLSEIGAAQAVGGDIPAAQQTFIAARDIESKMETRYSEFPSRSDRVWITECLAEIALGLARAGNREGASEWFRDSISGAMEIWWNEEERSETLSEIAANLARGGFGKESLDLQQMILANRNRHLPIIASAFIEAGDRENFKRILLPCAEYLDAAYKTCGLLARLFPERANAISSIVIG